MSLYHFLYKTAQGESSEERIPTMKEWFSPYPHQKAAIDKLFKNRGKMILAHEMGTGKTVTSIYGFEKLRNKGKATKALVVVPSGLRNNFAENGVKKFTDSTVQIIGSASEVSKRPGFVRPGAEGDAVYTVVSYAQFRRDPEGLMKRTGSDTLIFDEFHKTRNEQSSTFKAALAARKHAVNFMGLTASMINNSPTEMATLMTISEAEREYTPKQFKRKFVETVGFAKGFGKTPKKIIGLKNEEGLRKEVGPSVHYVATKDLKGKTMPKKEVQNVYVPMSKKQYTLYQLALDRLGPIKERIVRGDPNVSVRDAKQLFGQISQARQLANSMHTGRRDFSLSRSAKETPKVRRVLDDTEKHLAEGADRKVVLYSNLVTGGIDVLSQGLKDRGIDHAVFVGKGTEVGGSKVTSITRQDGVKAYKEGKKKVIIISGAGAEGLDLKNSTAFYALDGHFNPERVLQAEGRARRLGGQEHRAPEERKVDVRRYQSTVPDSAKPGFFGKLIGRKTPQTTDQWMYNVAGRKHTATKQFYSALKKPPKHLYKYTDSSGEVRYVYPKREKKVGLFSRLFNFGRSSKSTESPKPEGVKNPGELPKLL